MFGMIYIRNLGLGLCSKSFNIYFSHDVKMKLVLSGRTYIMPGISSETL